MKTIKETLAITHNNITIYVRIDYKGGKIDIVEPRGESSNFNLKKFTFAQRGIEYMSGWQNILDAIKNAVTVATERLEAYQKEEDEEKKTLLIKIAKQVNEYPPMEFVNKPYKTKKKK